MRGAEDSAWHGMTLCALYLGIIEGVPWFRLEMYILGS